MNGKNNNLSPTEYIKLSRDIHRNKKKNLQELNVAFFANYTLDIVEPFLSVEFAKHGYKTSTYYSLYGKIEEDILTSSSQVYSKDYDIFFIHLLFEDIFPNFENEMLDLKESNIKNNLSDFEEYLINLLNNIRANTNAIVYISNLISQISQHHQMLDQTISLSKSEIIYRFNKIIKEVTRKYSSIFIYNFSAFISDNGFNNIKDEKMRYFANVPFNAKYQIELAKSFVRAILSSIIVSKKCLVIDLDNTIWGGVIGEDGFKNIKLGEDFPGNIYKDFQRTILNLRNLGIFLAIASKNNIEDVLEVMSKNKNCLIKEEHISVMKVNWKDKVQNIKSIAEELNINLDSIVFFDDSQHEREWIKSQLPTVNVIDVPDNPLLYKDSLLKTGFFDSLSITNEDLDRPRLFDEEKKRRSSFKIHNNLESFILSLKMKISIEIINDINFARVVQLINKTNQFNLTLNRYKEIEVSNMIKKGFLIYCIRVEDKFGDAGLIGVVILKPELNNDWIIDTFLLSCRVLGRNIEKVILNFISKLLIAKDGKRLYGIYVAGEKNKQVKNFYKEIGFVKSSDHQEWYWEFINGEISENKIAEVIYLEK